MALLIAAGFGLVVLYSLLLIVRSHIILQRISARIRWHRNEYEEGSYPEVELQMDALPRNLRRWTVLSLQATWDGGGRSFALDRPLPEEVGEVVRLSATEPIARGNYIVSVALLRIHDPLHLFSTRRFLALNGILSVTSGVGTGIEISDRHTAGGEDARFNRNRERSDLLLETRPYVVGDNPQRISWNAFAHTGELHIRIGDELALPHREVIVIGDLRPTPKRATMPCLDQLLRVVLGTGKRLEELGYHVFYGWSNGERVGSGGQEGAQRATAGLTWDSRDGLSTFRRDRARVLVVSIDAIHETPPC